MNVTRMLLRQLISFVKVQNRVRHVGYESPKLVDVIKCGVLSVKPPFLGRLVR